MSAIATQSPIGKTKTTDTQGIVMAKLLAGPQITNDLDTSVAYMDFLTEEGLVQRKGTQKQQDENGNPKRGRPHLIWALTSKGRARAKRFAERAAQA